MVFPLLAMVHLILGVVYLYWRITAGTGDPQGWSNTVWVAEVFIWTAALSWFLSCLGRPHPLAPTVSSLPDVDVWVIQRWDSFRALEQTLKAIHALDYPLERLHIGVLDLENNSGLPAFLQTFETRYATCAGIRDPWELAFAQSISPYLLFLESGHLPDPDVLRGSLALLQSDPGMAYTQAQLRGFGQPEVRHPLQQITVVGRDGSGVAPLLGTGCVLRRDALAAVIAQGSLDSRQPLTLGSRLHRLGWMGTLVSHQVTGALLPLRNRRVALLGILNALRVNPILRGRASQQQRFQYGWLGLWSLSGFATLVYLVVPALYLLWGIAPVPSFGREYWLRFLPYVLSGRLAWIWAFWGTWGAAWQAERQMGSQFFQSLQASGQWLLGQTGYRERPSQWSIWPQVVITALLLCGIISGCLRFASGWEISWAALIFALLWSMYGLAVVTARPPGLWQRDP